VKLKSYRSKIWRNEYEKDVIGKEEREDDRNDFQVWEMERLNEVNAIEKIMISN